MRSSISRQYQFYVNISSDPRLILLSKNAGNSPVAYGVDGPGATSNVFEVVEESGEIVRDFTLAEDHSMPTESRRPSLIPSTEVGRLF